MTTKDVLKSLPIVATLVLILSSVTTASAPNSQPADWPMFQLDAGHTGFSSDNISPNPQLLWSRDFGSYVQGFGVYANGTFYVGDNVRIVSTGPLCKQGPSGGGVFRALNPKTGEVKWELACYKGDDIGIFTGKTTPAYADGIIYFGDSYGVITAARDEGDHGRILWQRNLGQWVSGSPIIADGFLYVLVYNALYALDPETGDTIWSLDLVAGQFIEASPAYADGVIYVAVGESGGYGTLRALAASSGEELWRLQLTYVFVKSAPTVSRQRVYVGSHKHVYAIDATTGETLWTREVKGGLMDKYVGKNASSPCNNGLY